MDLKLRMTQDNFIERLYIFIWTFFSIFHYILSETRIYSLYDVKGLFRIIGYATLFMQIIVLIAIRYKLEDFIAYIVLFLILFLIEIQNPDRSLMIYVMFIILSRQIDFDRFIKYDLKLKAFILLFIFGLCAVGIIDNRELVINGNYKQALGFSHPNTFCSYVFTMLIEWLCIRYKKMKWYEWILIAVLSYAAMKIGGGRSSGYTFFAVFGLYILATFFDDIFYSGIVKAVFIVITPLMAVISFWMVYLYGQGNLMAIELNYVFTGRLRLSYVALRDYGVKIFGQDIEWGTAGTSSRIILDNSYIRCAVVWGAVLFLLLMIVYCVLFAKLLNSYRVELSLMSLFFVVLGFGETHMLNVLYNVSMLCLLNCSADGLVDPMETVRWRKRNGSKRLKH